MLSRSSLWVFSRKVIVDRGSQDGVERGQPVIDESGVVGQITRVLVEPGKGGLQVENDGEWIDAPPVPGAFVVNIGELLEYATDGYLKATVHRVISPRLGDDRHVFERRRSPGLAMRPYCRRICQIVRVERGSRSPWPSSTGSCAR